MHRLKASPGDPLGPWTHQHSLGAGVVVLIVVAIAVNIWPGWEQLGMWFTS
jgi:hypothetical protein